MNFFFLFRCYEALDEVLEQVDCALVKVHQPSQLDNFRPENLKFFLVNFALDLLRGVGCDLVTAAEKMNK